MMNTMDTIRHCLRLRKRTVVHRNYLPDLLALVSRGEARTEIIDGRIYAVRPLGAEVKRWG